MTFWDIASAIFRAILFMSLSGSIIAGLLFLIKPLVRNATSKSAQYYLWVIVIAAYLLPLSVFVTLPVSTPLAPVQQIIETNVKSNEQWREQVAQEVYGESYKNLDIVTQVMGVEGELRERNVGDYNRLITNTFIFGMVFFLKAIAGYIVFTDKLRKSRIPARKNELALLPRKSPRLYRTTLAATPMLVGIIRPVIYLPDREYGEGQLEYILSHELTHLRRHDVAVKWLATLAAHVHWFNPVAWFAHREINKACELSCDEAVIRRLDNAAKQSYGGTLISVVSVGNGLQPFRNPGSMAICEEKKKLKERLVAIMNYKKKTKIAVLITAVLAVVITGSAFAVGAQSSFEIGVSASNIERDARKSQKISEWEVAKSINDNLCAMLFYNDTQDDHTFSIYVKGNGMRFGYFFRVGGGSSMIAEGVDEFSFDENGSAFLSMNKNRVARIELDNGNDISTIEIDPSKPFAVVIPYNSGLVALYDDSGNIVKVDE